MNKSSKPRVDLREGAPKTESPECPAGAPAGTNTEEREQETPETKPPRSVAYRAALRLDRSEAL